MSTRTRHDSGFTLIELMVVIAIFGVLAAGVGTGIITLLRVQPTVVQVVADSHDQQQLTDYFVADARSTSPSNIDFSTAAAGCPGATAGSNVIQFTYRTLDSATWKRSDYRLVAGATSSSLNRISCSGTSATTFTAGSTVTTNIADSLSVAPAGWTNAMAPAMLTPPGAGGSGTDNLVSLSLTRSRGTFTVKARLTSEFSAVATPAGTTPTTDVATTTTASTVAPTTTTAAPPTTVVGATGGACALLASLTASLTVPSAVTNPLLRNAVTGALVSPYRVSAAINASIGVSLLGILSLNLTLCATVQLAYNTGNTAVTAPMTSTATCTGTLLGVCVSVAIALYVDLPVSAGQPWTVGSHPISLVNQFGAALPVAAGSVTVAVDPTTTTTLPPATTPTAVAGAANNPVGAAQGFSVMTEGNVSLTGLALSGGVATGGDLSFQSSASIAGSAPSTFTVPGEAVATGLLAGGKIDFTSSSAISVPLTTGFVHVGSLSGGQVLVTGPKLVVNKSGLPLAGNPQVIVTNTAQLDQTNNPVLRPSTFPFTTAYTTMRASSAKIAALNPTSTCANIRFPQFYQQGSGWVLNLVTGQVNVLDLTAAQYNAISTLSGTGLPDATTFLVVNISDYGAVSLSTKSFTQFVNGTKTSILFNFANATTVNIAGAFYGTVYAPSSVVAGGASLALSGDVIAKSLTTAGGSITSAHFTKAIPCIG